MAISQLRRGFPIAKGGSPRETRLPLTRLDSQQSVLVTGSTAAIARSIELLVRTDNMPGMPKPRSRARAVRP